MPLTRDFKETVQARAQRDPAFREGLLKEGVECLLAGDVDAGKIILRDYINATIGFEELSSLTNKRPRASCACSGQTGILTPATFSMSSVVFSSTRASISK